MRDFKFFEENEKEWEGASWMWRTVPTRTPCEVVMEEHYGIHSFLSQFSSYDIIHVHTIVGPDGIIHDRYNDGSGWGFDITQDLIRITWIRFLG